MVRTLGLTARKTAAMCSVLFACALSPTQALAGTYSVTDTCGAWEPRNNAPARIAVYTECPTLVLRNVGGGFSSAAGQEGRWEFNAPPGTWVDRATLWGSMTGLSGWQAALLNASGGLYEYCPGPACPGGSKVYSATYPGLGTSQLVLRLRCGASSCPNGEGLRGYIDARDITVVLADPTTPSVSITGGDLLSGWRRGVGSVSFESGDNVGIRLDRVLVDGTPRGQALRQCANGRKIPCPNGGGSLALDTKLVSDGAHTLRVESVDSADNVGGQDRQLLVDNTPPAAPLQLAVEGGDAWRSTNGFIVGWRNPQQAHAPISGAELDLCPAENPLTDRKGCTRVSRTGSNLTRVADLQVPARGAWRARLWLRDAAGNHDEGTASTTLLRFDDAPPELVFHEQDPADPTLLRLQAADATSGVARAEIEIRRQGEDAWRSLAVERAGGVFTARIDDEVLPRGLYELRARVFDAAGNERSTSSRTNGRPAVLELPVRARAGLTVGRPGRLHCRGAGDARRCARRLGSSPSSRFGTSVRLLGRLVSQAPARRRAR